MKALDEVGIRWRWDPWKLSFILHTNIQKFCLFLLAGSSNFVLYTYELLVYFFFFAPLWSSVVSLLFTAWCHRFSLSVLCYEATVTDQSARQPCLKCKTPRYKGKCGVRLVQGTSPHLQPPATLPPAPCHLMLKVCGTWHWEITHTGHLKSWEVNNSFITCSGWGLPVALWRQGQGRE